MRPFFNLSNKIMFLKRIVKFLPFTIGRNTYGTLSLTLSVTLFQDVRRLYLHPQHDLLGANRFGYHWLIPYSLLG